MAERTTHPVLRFGFAVATILLSLAAVEMAMRYLDRPRGVVSGWRTTDPLGPVNSFGFRGQPSRSLRINDFVVLLTGGAAVECLECPRDETLDVMLERAVRQFNPNARVVTLGAGGYSQDQEYLALHQFLAIRHADLVIDWASIADDVPGNTFRSGSPRPGETRPKPTFALRGDDSVGPTENLGDQVYHTKVSTLLRPLFIDLDRNWTTLLPKADAGGASPPEAAMVRSRVADPLEQQRTPWSIWMTPRPARVRYGIALTRALLRHMRDLAMLRGARFVMLMTPDPSTPATGEPAPIALEHDGHWFLADPAAREAAVAEVTAGFDTITLPAEAPSGILPVATVPPVNARRQLMARLAEVLNERRLLTPVMTEHGRH